MKKLCLLLLSFLFLPLAVNAVAYSEVFEVGDSVSVDLYGTGEKVGFRVLKDSKAGEKTVRLLFDGAFNNINGTFDEPYEGHEVTNQFSKESYLYGKMITYVNDHHWNYIEIGLLTQEDLNDLGITNKEIPAAKKYLSPAKLSSEASLKPYDYNYWTQIPVENTTDQVYCVKYNEERTDENGVYANIVATNVNPTDAQNDGCAIKPVIVVDKSIILCNNNPHTTTTTKPAKSPDTGVSDYIMPLAFVALFAGSAFVIANKKSSFKNF